MSELPKSWLQAQIGEITNIVNGGTPPSKNPANFTLPGQGIPWITPADLSGYHDQTIERGTRDLSPIGYASCSATLVPKGTILFSSRAPIGYVVIAANEISTNQGFKNFVLPEGFDPRFAYYQLQYLKPQAEAIATGTTFKELSTSSAAKLPFKVAPLKEQTRIADYLDILFARIQSCNERIENIPILLNRFRQAILNSALVGDLTSKKEHSNDSKSWSSTTISSICESSRTITYGVIKLGNEVQGGTPCLRTSNVRWLRFELEGMKHIDPDLSAQYPRTILQGGEVLVNVRGTLGGVAVAKSEMKGWNISREVAVLPIDITVANPDYVAFWIASENSQKWLSRMEKGIAYVGINIEDLRMLPIRVPPLAEQSEIVARIQSLLSLAAQIEAYYCKARIHGQRLKPLLLSKAFRGELLPQDPNDEPVSQLLKQISQHKASQRSLKKSNRSPKEMPMKTPSQFSLSEIITQIKGDCFTFEQLRNAASRDYESLKNELFAMLADSKSGLTQVFDSETKSMKFKKVSK